MSKIFGNKEMRILMLGLDAAGKTSILFFFFYKHFAVFFNFGRTTERTEIIYTNLYFYARRIKVNFEIFFNIHLKPVYINIKYIQINFNDFSLRRDL